MKKLFFNEANDACNQITETFDLIWPISVGLWNLRCNVNGVKSQVPNITEPKLAAKFSEGSGIHGVNYKKSTMDTSWVKQKEEIAWLLLNSTITIFEGWLERMKENHFQNLNVKNMQFPETFEDAINRLRLSESHFMVSNIFPYFEANKKCETNLIREYLVCDRVFKEIRNCYMHNGKKCNQRLINSKALYDTDFDYQRAKLKKEIIVPNLTLNEEVCIEFSGVVGFTDVLIRLIISLESRLIKSEYAEHLFWERYRGAVTDRTRKLKQDSDKADKQIKNILKKIHINAIEDVSAIKIRLFNPKFILYKGE